MTLVGALLADRFYVILHDSVMFYDAPEPEGEILQNIHSTAWACKPVRLKFEAWNSVDSRWLKITPVHGRLWTRWDMMEPVDSGIESHGLVTLSS